MSQAAISRERDGVRPVEKRPEFSMSEKQLQQTVRRGRKVTFLIFDGEPITGYLAGMDDEYYLVLEPDPVGNTFKRWMVTRSCNPAFELHEEETYQNEKCHVVMDEIIGPFRGWISARRNSDARKAG